MKFILGVIVGFILVGLSVICYFELGMAPVETAAQAMPFEKQLARIALDKRVEKEAPKTPPPGIQADDDTLMNGAMVYTDDCAVCHGYPGAKPSHAALGMFPKPPQLFHGKGVTDDPPGETYWKVENGIRLTGMPAFKGNITEKEIWSVALLLANADKLPDDVKNMLKPPANAHDQQ
jgi:thiosulfate dehydrogenase